jgi:flagellar biosynthesis/type III secretory pathway protein FliH
MSAITNPAVTPASSDSCRVVKAEAARGWSARVADPDQWLHDSCSGYLDEIRQQARQILADAHAEAESIRRRAYAQGETAGQQAGLTQRDHELQARALDLAQQIARRDFAPAAAALRAAADAVSAARDAWLARWETDAVRLSLAIAKKLVRNELRHRPELVAETVRELLQLAAGRTDVSVQLHPRDLELISSQSAAAGGSIAAVAVRWVANENLSRGDCVVATRHGEVDARLETQLARIACELLPEESPLAPEGGEGPGVRGERL